MHTCMGYARGIHRALHVRSRSKKLFSLLNLCQAAVKVTGQDQLQQGSVQGAFGGLDIIYEGGGVRLGLVPALMALVSTTGQEACPV